MGWVAMTEFASARDLLRKHGLHAKKSWGQNFLVEERAYDAIVRAAGAGPEDTVVEIGAGLGTLTARLARAAGRVIAIERDRDMVAVLRAELGGDPRVEIAEANALTFDYAAARRETRLIVVGNLPYQIASPILFRLLDARAAIARIVVMLQKEMADRIVAGPGTKTYGALSVMVQMVGDARIVAKVAPGAFVPAPKVASAVLKIEPLPATRVTVSDEKHFSGVVHAAFGQRRKTLRNALRAMAPDAAIEAALARVGIDGTRRGETLSVAEFAALADALEA
jgi:16S rRNA (adenine1518-N6/adenine1519-N6)-dimethyltransferase